MEQEIEERDLSSFQTSSFLYDDNSKRNTIHTLSSNPSTARDRGRNITLRRAGPRNLRVTTERFFEECFDSDITVLREADFERGKQIRSVPSAVTCRGLLKSNSKSEVVAIRYVKASLSSGIRPPFGSEPNQQALLDKTLLELKVLSHSKLRQHDNIPSLIAVSWRSEFSPNSQHLCGIYPVIITELLSERYATLGEILTLSGPVPFTLRLELLRDLVEGLTAIQGLQSVSADLQPQNIVLFESSDQKRPVAKLASFRWRASQQLQQTDLPAVSYWAPPEYLHNAPEWLQRFSRLSHGDTYTFGLVASFILTGEAPFVPIGEEPDKVLSLKMQNKVSGLLASPWRRRKMVSVDDSQQWEVLRDGQWSIEEKAPGTFLELLPRSVTLQPDQRPDLRELRANLIKYTQTRAEFELPEEEMVPPSIESSRRYVDSEYWQVNPELDDIQPESPLPLKQQLYKSLQSRMQKSTALDERQKLLTLIGDFFLQAFDSSQALDEAWKWYMLAAVAGSTEAMAMMFRFERIMHKSIPELNTDITPAIRSMWLVKCMIGRIRKYFDPSLAPHIDLTDAQSKLSRVLNTDVWLASLGLSQDLDESIVRLRSYSHVTFPDWTATTRGFNVSTDKDMVLILQNDDAEAMDKLLQTSNHAGPLLMGMAAEAGAVRVIYLLALKYHCNVDAYITDSKTGMQGTALILAAMRSDVSVFHALLGSGADTTSLMARGVMDSIVRHGSDRMLREALNAILSRRASEPVQELFGTINMCHQVLDGICLAMRYLPTGEPTETPPDNSNPPPLFEAIVFNRIERIQSLLSRGANPNVFAQGFSALTLAVRMCRPMAVLLLLAFGADPNVRNPANGYGTPLHDLSDATLKAAIRDGEKRSEYKAVDLIGRDYDPVPDKDDSHDIRRQLILRALLEYGAQTDLLSIEGFTPLMVAIASPSNHALMLVKQFVQAGVSLTDKGLGGETALHIAILASNDAAMRTLLEVRGNSSIVNLQDDNGATPLILATRLPNRDDVLDQLLASGADTSVRGPGGLTALDVALIEGRKSAITKLMQHLEKMPPGERSPTLATCDETGRSVFHYVSLFTEQEVQVEVTSKLLSWLPEPKILIAKDRTNMSAMDFARHGNAQAIVKLFQVQLQTHSIQVIERKPSGLEKQVFEKEVEAIKSFLNPESSLKEREQLHAENCRHVLEQTGSGIPGQVILTTAEAGNLMMLENVTAEHGSRHPLTIWCMNNLGTVYERYGRLVRAQEILYRGWNLAKEVLGPDSMLTHDFACKVLRVIKCRGLSGVDGLDVAKWHTKQGRQTLRSFFSIVSEQEFDRQEVERLTMAGRGGQSSEVRMCDRDRCSKLAVLTCPECRYAQYCSETCLANDIMDPNSDHLAVCFPTETLYECSATIVRPKALRDSESLINLCWTNIRKNFPHLEKVAQPPPIQDVTQVDLNPAILKNGIAFTLKENTVVIFLNHDFCESKVLVRPPSPWKKLGDMNIFMAVMDVIIWLRPTSECAEAEDRHVPLMALIHFQGSVAWLANPNDRPGTLNTNTSSAHNSTNDLYMSGARSPEIAGLTGLQPLSNSQSVPIRQPPLVSNFGGRPVSQLLGPHSSRSQVPQMNRISSSPGNLQVNAAGQTPPSRLKKLFSKQPGRKN